MSEDTVGSDHMPNDETPQLTPEIERVLERYLEIQDEWRALREEKAGLQERLAHHLAGAKARWWYPELAGRRLKICHTRTATVTYDEGTLRERLGARFRHLLKPDLQKIKRCLPEVESHLAPIIEMVGSVNRDGVRDAIRQGLVRKEEFVGAFTKSVQTRIAVMRVRERSEDHSAPGPGGGV